MGLWAHSALYDGFEGKRLKNPGQLPVLHRENAHCPASTPKNSNKLFPYLHAWFTLYFTSLEHLFFSLGTSFLFISFLHKLSFVFAKPEAFLLWQPKWPFASDTGRLKTGERLIKWKAFVPQRSNAHGSGRRKEWTGAWRGFALKNPSTLLVCVSYSI